MWVKILYMDVHGLFGLRNRSYNLVASSCCLHLEVFRTDMFATRCQGRRGDWLDEEWHDVLQPLHLNGCDPFSLRSAEVQIPGIYTALTVRLGVTQMIFQVLTARWKLYEMIMFPIHPVRRVFCRTSWIWNIFNLLQNPKWSGMLPKLITQKQSHLTSPQIPWFLKLKSVEPGHGGRCDV